MEIYVDDEAKLTLHGLVQVRIELFALCENAHVFMYLAYLDNSIHFFAALHKT